MKILNIYGQESHHTNARIIGNRDGLLELRDAIAKAIKTSKSRTSTDEPLFASDGEGYEIIVECHDDAWGLAGGPDSFWSKAESDPEYTSLLGQDRPAGSGG